MNIRMYLEPMRLKGHWPHTSPTVSNQRWKSAFLMAKCLDITQLQKHMVSLQVNVESWITVLVMLHKSKYLLLWPTLKKEKKKKMRLVNLICECLIVNIFVIVDDDDKHHLNCSHLKYPHEQWDEQKLSASFLTPDAGSFDDWTNSWTSNAVCSMTLGPFWVLSNGWRGKKETYYCDCREWKTFK